MKTWTMHSDFPYRGPRDYVLLVDLYLWSLGEAKAAMGGRPLTQLAIKLHRKITKNCDLFLQEGEGAADRQDASGIFSFTCEGKAYAGALVENGREVGRRIEFDEERVFRNTSFSPQNGLALTVPTGFPPSEMLITLTKQLHVKLFPEAKGKWLATGIQLDREIPDTFSSLELRNVSRVGFRLTKNRVRLDGQDVGFTFFSLG